jgi:hypothetical protein
MEVKTTDSFACCPKRGYDSCGFSDPEEGHNGWSEWEDLMKKRRKSEIGRRLQM